MFFMRVQFSFKITIQVIKSKCTHRFYADVSVLPKNFTHLSNNPISACNSKGTPNTMLLLKRREKNLELTILDIKCFMLKTLVILKQYIYNTFLD